MYNVSAAIPFKTNKMNKVSMISAASGFSVVWMWLAVFVGLVLVTMLAVHLYYIRTESYKLALEIPGPYPLPLLGNAHMAIGKSSNGE